MALCIEVCINNVRKATKQSMFCSPRLLQVESIQSTLPTPRVVPRDSVETEGTSASDLYGKVDFNNKRTRLRMLVKKEVSSALKMFSLGFEPISRFIILDLYILAFIQESAATFHYGSSLFAGVIQRCRSNNTNAPVSYMQVHSSKQSADTSNYSFIKLRDVHLELYGVLQSINSCIVSIFAQCTKQAVIMSQFVLE